MKVIRPVPFMGSNLVSTTAVEMTAVYSPATNYLVGEEVLFNNFIYESLQHPNTGNQPDLFPAFWLRVRPSNTWAMFDSTVSTQTVTTSPFVVVLEFNKIIDSLALLNMSGVTSVNVEIQDINDPMMPVIYSKSTELDDSVLTDWYDYFFADFDVRGDLVLTDIPPYSNTRVTLTFLGSSNVAVGFFQVGNLFEIGGTQYGVGLGIRDYSVKETDQFGNTTFVERAFSKKMTPTVYISNSRLNAIFKVLSDLRAKPTVFIGSEEPGFEVLILFGFLKDWNIEIPYPKNSLISFDIEGLI